MSDLASDRIAALELVIEEYKRLQKDDPHHELLKYIVNISKVEFSGDETIRQEFIDKYAPDEKTPVALMFGNYFLDLRDAVDKIEGIDRKPKLSVPGEESPEKRYGEGELPF